MKIPNKSEASRSTKTNIFAVQQALPLRTDALGRKVFDDGSRLNHTCLGEAIVSQYDVSEWIIEEAKAFDLGLSDRRQRRKMNRDFLQKTARYPRKIRQAYCRGWFAVPSW